jgi:hypothetical protein
MYPQISISLFNLDRVGAMSETNCAKLNWAGEGAGEGSFGEPT